MGSCAVVGYKKPLKIQGLFVHPTATTDYIECFFVRKTLKEF